MEILTLIFKLAAGIGLFLFAMYLPEESLKNLSGRNFKLFLQRTTKNRVGAVAGGAVTESLYQQLNAQMEDKIKPDFKKLQNIFTVIQDNYSLSLNNFYKEAQNAPIENLDITTALNFNRELFTSNKAMLMAVKDFLLEEKEANDFNEIPVYKT